MQRLAIISLFAITLAIASTASAAEKAVDNAQDAAIRKTVATFEESFNRADAKSLAACWTPDGDFTGSHGERIVGREKIESAFQQFLAAQKNSKLRLGIVACRHLSDSVAVVDAIAAMTPTPAGLDGEPRSTILLVKRDNQWLIDSIRETVVSTPSHYGHLKDLGWLVGNWTDATGRSSGAVVHSTCDWTANGSFLIRKFSATEKDGTILSGTEVIGWDPRAHRIHSWIFNSDGSFGESEWTRDGERWNVKYNGVLADGGDVTATHVLTRTDADTLTLKSTARLVNGEPRPDVAEVTIKRTADTKPEANESEKLKQVLPQ